jgi:hypothetical protein
LVIGAFSAASATSTLSLPMDVSDCAWPEIALQYRARKLTITMHAEIFFIFAPNGRSGYDNDSQQYPYFFVTVYFPCLLEWH